MHWRTPFPPKRPSVLAELLAVVRGSLRPDVVLADQVMAGKPAELPPAVAADEVPVTNAVR